MTRAPDLRTKVSMTGGWRRGATVVLALAVGLAVAGRPRAIAGTGGVTVQPVSPNPAFPDAVAPGALNWCCAARLGQLREAFADRGAPFDDRLVRKIDGRPCHIDYRPSIPGFRADADDEPIVELFANLDTMNLLAQRSEPFGDTIDITKAVLERLPRPIPLTVTAEQDIDPKWYQEAAAFHFGARADQIWWRRDGVPGQTHPWTQDFLKSGRADVENRVLITRHLYEGRQQDGTIYAPMLEALEGERFVRSNLSWEGGDLQFVRQPGHPDRLLLAYGDSARNYWGDGLEPGEYEYVLKREFGADIAIDLSQLVPHVDYLISFLPAARTVLLSQPLTGSREVALAAANVLSGRFGGGAPATLVQLTRLLAEPDAFTRRRRDVLAALEKAKKEARDGWPRTVDRALGERMARHVAAHCPTMPQGCFSNEGISELLATDLPFLKSWVTAAMRGRAEARIDPRLLSVIESQLQQKAPPTQARLDEKARELESLGFRVVRIPRLGGDPSLDVPWAGISYANSLLVDRTLFVPSYGLGEVEDAIFDDLRRQLPTDLTLVPVYARQMLMYNGGVHCTVAIVRGSQ